MAKDPIQLSDHFSAGRLLRFALPSIAMMVFTSIYSVVDGLFVSNLVGKDALAAVNLAFPLLMALGGVGFMFGTGGAALVSKVMGEGNARHANQLFTLIMLACAVTSVVLAVAGELLLPHVLSLLGAEGTLLQLGLEYGRILLLVLPVFAIQNAFQSFFIAAERPTAGLVVTVAAGLTNMVGDYVLIACLDMGIAGAAWATGLGQALAAAVPLFYFRWAKGIRLRFAVPRLELWAVGRTCLNGSSELAAEVSASVVSTLYNFQLMQLVGPDGVAAYGVIMYVHFVFAAVFFGFAMGAGPVISFHYGAKNKRELRGLFRRGFGMVAAGGALMLAVSWMLGSTLVNVFVGYDQELSELTLYGFRIFALSFLACGVNIFGSAFFTALNNGVLSAAVSFFRTIVCEVSAILLLPLVLGVNGIWLSVVVAEACALALTVFLLVKNGNKYGYRSSASARAEVPEGATAA